MHTRKSREDGIELCGTPVVTSADCEEPFATFTVKGSTG